MGNLTKTAELKSESVKCWNARAGYDGQVLIFFKCLI